jgi:DedD protein
MERRVKERLIGASILVVLVVLVVPELLSGPKVPTPASAPLLPKPSVGEPPPVRNVTVDLATSKPAITESDVASAPPQEAPSAAPNPVSAAPAASPPGSVSAPLSAPAAGPKYPIPMPQKAAVETPVPSPTSMGDWSVQLGSFANRGNADNLVKELKARGFAAFDSPTGSGKAQRFRVRVGPYGDRAATERGIAKLKAAGHQGTVVAPAH